MADYPYSDLHAPQTDPAKMQARFRMMNNKMRNMPAGTPFYLQVTGDETGVMELGRYANPELALSSDYFRSLNSMMQCVEKNLHVTDAAAQERVCANEFKNLRLAAFQNKLLYSEVNKKHFMREIQYKNNYGGF